MCLGFARAAGLDPGECLMIGDNSHDLVSGRAAGMHTVAVATALRDADELAPLQTPTSRPSATCRVGWA